MNLDLMESSCTAEFTQQLSEVQSNARETAREYPDLPLEGRLQCRENLKDTIKTLQKIEQSLEDLPENRIVQVLGLKEKAGYAIVAHDFEVSFDYVFEQQCHSKVRPELPRGRVLSFVKESNYVINADKSLTEVDQYFLEFDRAKDAELALKLGIYQFWLWRNGAGHQFKITFVKPSCPPETRAIMRKVGDCVKVIRDIQAEYRTLGAVTDPNASWSKPVLPPQLQDEAWFSQDANLPAMKRLRAQGKPLSREQYHVLVSFKVVNRGEIEARLQVLFDKEVDTRIELLEAQLALARLKVDFSFVM